MLPPDSRTTLIKQLTPPPGFAFEHLVATTFTLDLESALLPSLALAGSARVETADSVETIAAIRASIARIDIFHQTGMVAVPRESVRLFSLLENSIHGITRDRGLFHPKLWLGMYRNGDEQFVRLIVASRNLTKDRSWDIALSLDGGIVSTPSAVNRPLADLLRYLASSAEGSVGMERGRRLAELASTIRFAKWEFPSDVTDLGFHVFGLLSGTKPKPDFGGYRNLVMAPFLEDAGIERFGAEARNTLDVVSRQESLDGLTPEIADWIDNAYVLSPTAGIPDDHETSSPGSLFNGLHAKLYAVERARLAHLFVGSANATRAAFEDNLEILVEVTGKVGTYGVDALMGTDGFGPILDSAVITPGTSEDKDPQFALDAFVRSVAAVPLTAHLSLDPDDVAQLDVTSVVPVPATSGVSVSLRLLTDASTQTALKPDEPVRITYENLRLSEVTAFCVLFAQDVDGNRSATLVKAHLIGDVPRRLDQIVTHEIDSAEKFRRLLSLLLAFGTPDSDEPGDGTVGVGGPGRWALLEQGLFEQMMKVSVSHREVLDQLSGVVTSIIESGDPNHILPEGFEHLWCAIAEATDTKTVANV